MTISLDELRHIAHLARLNLSEEELLAMHHDLNRVMESFRQLQELRLSGIELTPHSVDIANVWGEDTPEPNLSHEEALAPAPSTEGGLFLVPTIIDWE